MIEEQDTIEQDPQQTDPDPQPKPKLGVKEFAQRIKAKYPEYKDIDDTILTQKIIAKYPEYKEHVELGDDKKKVQPDISQLSPNGSPSTSNPEVPLANGDWRKANSTKDFVNQQSQPFSTSTGLSRKNELAFNADFAPSKESIQKENEEVKQGAINTTATRRLKAKSKSVNDESLKTEKEAVQSDINSGKLILSSDGKGNKIYARQPGAGETFIKGLATAERGLTDAATIAYTKANGTPEDLAFLYENIAHRKKVESEKEFSLSDELKGMPGTSQFKDSYAATTDLPTAAPTTAGSLTEMVGGLAPDMALAAGTGGLGNVAKNTIIGGKMLLSGYSQKAPELYERRKHELIQGGMDEKQASIHAAQDATTDAVTAAIPDAAVNTLFFSGKLHSPAADNFVSVMKGAAKDAIRTGALGAAGSGATSAIEGAQGYNVDGWINKMLGSGGDFAKMDMLFKVLPILRTLPKAAQSAVKEFAVDPVVKPFVENYLKTVPEGIDVMKDLQDYEDATKDIRGVVPEEKMASLGGRMQKRINRINGINIIKGDIMELESKKRNLPESLHEDIDNSIKEKQRQISSLEDEIGDIDKDIETINKSKGSGLEKEIDEATGEPIISKKESDTKLSEPIEGLDEQGVPITENKKTESDDNKNIEGISSEKRIRQESIQAKPDESAGSQEIGNSGMVQSTPQEELDSHEEYKALEDQVATIAKDNKVNLSLDEIDDIVGLHLHSQETDKPLSLKETIDFYESEKHSIPAETEKFTESESVEKVEPADDVKITSIKNEITRVRREQLGLKEEEPTLKKEFGTTWDEAKEKIENGFETQDLINELKKKPRAVNDVETALLLHHQNTKELQLIHTNEEMNKAAESNNTAVVEESKVRRARLLDELQDIYDVDKSVGRETARGLSARQMMIDRKYNLVNMMAEKRATNDGEPLTTAQEKDIEVLHEKIKTTEEAFDKYVQESEDEIKNLQEKILGKEPADKKSAAAKLREWADKIDEMAKDKAFSSVIPITPKMISGAMRLIADGLEKGGKVIDLIKKAIDEIKKVNPDIDEAKLYKEINKAAIESGIGGVTPEAKKAKEKDFSGLFSKNKLDRKAFELKAKAQLAKDAFDVSIKKDEAKKRSSGSKIQDNFVKWQRAFKLSNPVTMGKLAMAGLTRLTTTPAEDLVGGVANFILPKSLTKDALGEGGGLNVIETVKAYTKGFVEGMKDSYSIMKKGGNGKSDLDVVFGKGAQLPPEAIDFFGSLHSATKAPFKRIIFERSLSKRFRRSINNGIDVSDPMIQSELAVGAYKDANRAIFMQDNKVSDGWQKMVSYFDKTNAKTGKAPAKLTATTLKWLVPFVKVPTNIAAEIGTNVYGLPIGIAKIIHGAFTKGLENLSGDEKDIILRNIKKGSLGAAALSLGYFNPQYFGGYYQEHEKRDKNDAKAGAFKIAGHNIPAWLIESPIFQAIQIGATMRRVKDAKVKGEEKGIIEGMWAAALGMAEHVPMVDQPMRIFEAIKDPKKREYFLGELIKNTAIPSLVQKVAEWSDTAEKRNPQTISEHLKAGIPGLREQIAEKQNKTFTIKDPHSNKKREATPQEFDSFNEKNRKRFEEKLTNIKSKGVWMNKYGEVTLDVGSGVKRKRFIDLTPTEKTAIENRLKASSSDEIKKTFKFR